MISFRNDYSEGAHPAILAALQATNLESTPGYGRDHYCEAAAEAVRARFACPQADVHFMLGGTLTNLTLIAAALRPWEAVIAADTSAFTNPPPLRRQDTRSAPRLRQTTAS